MKISGPVRIDAPERLTVAAHPSHKVRPAPILGNLYGPVEGKESAAAGDLCPELFEVIALQGGVAGEAVCVNEDGVGLLQFVRGRPFSIEMHVDIHEVGRTRVQAFGQKLDPGLVLMAA